MLEIVPGDDALAQVAVTQADIVEQSAGQRLVADALRGGQRPLVPGQQLRPQAAALQAAIQRVQVAED